MKISGSLFRPLKWLMTMVLIAFVAGCGGGGGGDTSPAGAGASLPTGPGAGGGVGGVGHGPVPLELHSAANFAVLAETAITNAQASVINGNVGLSPAPGSENALTCAEVVGVIYAVAAGGARCRTVNAALLTQAVNDGHAAWHDAVARVADYIEVGGGNIGGMTLPPATYRWSTGVQIPSNLTLQGGPNDVWIFLIEHDLIVDPGVQILLLDGALPQNIYWVTVVNNVEIGAGAYFRGVILAETFIDMKTGASIDGRLAAAQAINLDANVVTQP